MNSITVCFELSGCNVFLEIRLEFCAPSIGIEKILFKKAIYVLSKLYLLYNVYDLTK